MSCVSHSLYVLVDLVAQLHNSLPSMVVEILEEKLEREYCDNADKLLLKEISKGLIAAFSDDDSDDRDGEGDGDVSVKNEAPNILELPKSWESMTFEEVGIGFAHDLI